MKYFANLPLVSYANAMTRNILTRVKVSNTPSYYPYTMSDGQKIEHIAYDYYEESDDVWVLHHINNVIDPYFDYSLDQSDFDRYIEKKYGSIYKAKRDIAFYHTNYYSDDSILEISEYEALNPPILKKYWSPQIDVYGNPYQYVRSTEDIIINTNKIISANISLITANSFVTGEKISQTGSSATAFIGFSNSTVITFQHITGTFNTNNIIGEDSGAQATVSAITVISSLIDTTESSYYSSISYYDYEMHENNRKKSINVLDKSYLESVSSQFRQLVNE